MRSHVVMGVRVDDVSRDDARALFVRWLDGDARHVVVTPNPEFLLLARRSERFRQLLNAADLAVPDGTGLRFAIAALTDSKLTHRIPGVELLQMLHVLCAERSVPLVTVGSSSAMVDAGIVRGGVGDATLDADVVARVRDLAPAVVAVGLGQGKQEEVIARHAKDWPTAKILVGVGGAIDILAGRRLRAPKALRSMGLEWLWRLVIEPRRMGRILRAFPGFPVVVVWITLRERRFLKACRATIPEIFRQLFWK